MSRRSGPAHLARVSRLQALRRTARGLRRDGLTDRAAALTYYGVLSLFPAIVALLSVVGLLNGSARSTLEGDLESLTPGPAQEVVRNAVTQLSSKGSASLALVLGVLGALWAASSYVAAYTRASNAIWQVEERRPVWERVPLRFVVTVVCVVLVAASAISAVATGAVAERIARHLGVGSTALTVWDAAKWPVMVLVAVAVVGLLMRLCPDVHHARLRWVSAGALLAVLVAVVASAGFAAYVAWFHSYNRTYGSVAGVIVLLVWMWLSNLALLLGTALDAELERDRAGVDAMMQDNVVDLRDEARTPQHA